MVHDPATLASPDLLSDVPDMKQDLIQISGFLTSEVSELSLVDGLKYYVDNEDEPFEIVEKVKEDLEKLGKILSVENTDKESKKPWFSNIEATEEKTQVMEPLLTEVRITRATDCSSAHQKDASEMVSHLSTNLESYLQELPVTAHPVPEENAVEETFTEVVLPRKRHPPRIKKPARKKLKEREFVSCSSEDELERMSSEESLDGDTVLGEAEPGLPPVSPKIIETPIGSIKDRVKALQMKVEEEEKEESAKAREVRRVTALTAEENYTPPPKSPKSPRSQTERIEHSMSVKELMKAFQTGQDPSKSKCGLFEHKVITELVVTSSTEVSEETKNAQISDLQNFAVKPSSEEINSQSITGESSEIIHDQYQQNKIEISDEIIHEQVQRTSEDSGVSKTSVDFSLNNKDSWRVSGLHSENTLISVREELYKAPDEHTVQYGEQEESSNMPFVYQEEGKKEILSSKDKIIQNNAFSKELCQDEMHAKDLTVTLEVWPQEEEQYGPEIRHYKKLSTSHERRTSDEPQISPNRKTSEDFSAVIKEELEENPEYQLFLQAGGPSPVIYTSYSETHITQDGDQVGHTAVEHHSYKPKPAIRCAPAVVQNEKFISTLIHDEEINEKIKRNVQTSGDSTDIMFRSRTPKTSLEEDEAYEGFKQSAQTSPSDQEVKSPTKPEDQTEETSAMQSAYTESGSPTKSTVQTRLEEIQETKDKDKQDQDKMQATFYMEIKSPVHTELEVIQKSPTDIKSKVQTEQEISSQGEKHQLNKDMYSDEVSSVETFESEELKKIQDMSPGPHDLRDPQPVTISDLKINSSEMTPDKEDLTSHKSPDLVQVSSTEIKAKCEESHFHKTEQVQQVCINTVEKMTVTETKSQTHAEEERDFTVNSGITVQTLYDGYEAPVPEDAKQIMELEIPEVQEIQQMPYSTSSSSRPHDLDVLQYVTSDPESGCKSDLQKMTPGKEGFSTQKSPDLVQVSSREIKSPVQTEETSLHKTEEDHEPGCTTTVEKVSHSEIQTQIQTEEEADVNVGVDSPIQDPLYTYQDKETKQTGHIFEISSEVTAESGEYQQIQQRLYSAVNLDMQSDMQSATTSDPESACQVDPQETSSGKEDNSPHKSPHSVQVSTTEIKSPVQTMEAHFHETEEESQHMYKTTLENTTITETKTPTRAEEGIDFTNESGITVQILDDSFEAPAPDETTIGGIYEISTAEFHQIQQMPYSMSSTSSPGILDDQQYVTSDAESGCKSDSQKMTHGEEGFSTQTTPESVQVSSKEIKSPVQTERKTSHETEETDWHGYKTTEIQTQSQTEVEISINMGVDTPAQDLHDTYQVYERKEISAANLRDLQPVSTSDPESPSQEDPQETTSDKEDLSSPDSVQAASTGIDYVYSVETARPERLQKIQQTFSRPDNFEDLLPVTMTDPTSVCQGDSLETTPIKEDLSSKKSPDSIEPSPTKDISCPDSLETSPMGQRPDFKRPDLLHETSNHSQNSQPAVSLTENIELEMNNEIIIQREAKIPGSQCLSTALNPHPAPLDGENLQSPTTLNETSLYMGVKVGTFDDVKDPEIEKVHSDSSVELMVEDVMMTEGGLIQNEDNVSFYTELPDRQETLVTLQQSLEGNYEEDQEISEVKKQFTPEEKMFKMAAKIRVFDEIEKETKTRKVRFDFATSQDQDDELQERKEELQSCDETPLRYEEEDTRQKCGPESSIVLSSYQESEQCNDAPHTDLPQEEPEQALNESQVSECTYSHGAAEIGETEMEMLPMQIHIEKKEPSHKELTPECLIKEDKADTMAALAEDSAAMLMANKIDSNLDIECHIIDEKTVKMPESFIDTVCPINDEKCEEEHQLYGYEEDHAGKSQRISELNQRDLVPWSAEMEDEEQKIHFQTTDTRSPESTLEMPPARTPTENGQPNPFLFQEGKLFEMTRVGAIDMSRRSMEEEQDGFVFFPISEHPSEDSPCGQVSETATEFNTPLEVSLHLKSEDSPQYVSGPSDEPNGSESSSGSEIPKEIDLGFDSTIADVDTATSTVTRSIYSEQDMESSDSSAEEDQHSVIEIPTPTQEDLMFASGETLQVSSHWSLSSPKDPAAEPEGRKPKSKIPVKATSFDHIVVKSDSTEQKRRPKSETEIGLSDFSSCVHTSVMKPKSPVSKTSMSVEETSSGALPSGQPQFTHEGEGAEMSPDERDSSQTVLSGDCRPTAFQTPSVGEDIFETRPNWEDCVETQMQRLSDSSSPDQSKGTYMVCGPFFPTLKNNPLFLPLLSVCTCPVLSCGVSITPYALMSVCV